MFLSCLGDSPVAVYSHSPSQAGSGPRPMLWVSLAGNRQFVPNLESLEQLIRFWDTRNIRLSNYIPFSLKGHG